MLELTTITYYPEREDRVSGYTFYPGWIQTDGDLVEGKYKMDDPKNVYNEAVFNINPGVNYLTENQIRVLNATPSIADKIKNKIIEIDHPVQPVVQPPVAATPVAATPVAATPVAATPVAATPVAQPTVQPTVQPTDTRKRPPLEENKP